MTDNVSEFRITTWPSGPLDPVEEVYAPDEYHLVGNRIEAPFGAHIRSYQVPDEIYLRGLRDLDLDDPKAIESFVQHHGWLGLARHRLAPQLHPEHPLRKRIDAEWTEEDRRLGFRSFEHIDEFRHWIGVLRNLTTIHRDYQAGALPTGPPSPPREATTPVGPTGWHHDLHRVEPRNEAEYLSYLENGLAALLRPFHARIELIDPQDPKRPLTSPTRETPGLLHAAALQLFNHIATESEYKVCENNTCRRLFVHQVGRAKQNQYRTKGVDYCTAACARAVATRKYRKRQQEGTT